jgi:hypothetical protein
VLLFMIGLSVCLSLQPLLDLGRFFQFLILYTVGRAPWTGDQPVLRLLPTHRTTQTQTDIHAWNGIRTTIPVFEKAKTVHASDRAATVIGVYVAVPRILRTQT